MAKIQLSEHLPQLAKHLPRRVQLQLSEEQIKELEENIDLLYHGDVSTIATICQGRERCPYGDACPFRKTKPPAGYPCPLESMYAEKWLEDYITSYGLDPGNKGHMALVQALVTTEIELMRARAQLAREGFEQQTYISETTDKGERVRIEKKLHNLHELVDRLEKRRLSYIRELNKLTEDSNIDAKLFDPAHLLKKLRGEE